MHIKKLCKSQQHERRVCVGWISEQRSNAASPWETGTSRAAALISWGRRWALKQVRDARPGENFSLNCYNLERRCQVKYALQWSVGQSKTQIPSFWTERKSFIHFFSLFLKIYRELLPPSPSHPPGWAWPRTWPYPGGPRNVSWNTE